MHITMEDNYGDKKSFPEVTMTMMLAAVCTLSTPRAPLLRRNDEKFRALDTMPQLASAAAFSPQIAAAKLPLHL